MCALARAVLQIASAGRVLSSQGVGSINSGTDTRRRRRRRAVIVAWEWTSCLSPNGGNTHDHRGNITNRTRANWLAYRDYLQDSS